MKTKVVISLFLFLFAFTGCDVAKQMTSAYNMTQCKYDYNSISGLSIAGVDLSKGLQPLQLLQLTPLLTGQATSVPLNFTLNLDVNNPNTTSAMLHGLQYILSVDGVHFTSGTVNQALNIASGETQKLPLTLGFDIASLLSGESKSAVENIVKNFIGVGSESTKVTFQIKPTFMVGNVPIQSPVYIPVNFTFGGKK